MNSFICDSNDFKNKEQKINFKNEPANKIFLENILEKIKISCESDYNVFNDIYYFLNNDFDFDQIVNLSIYKDDIINTTIKKYKYLFNICIEPINI